MFTVLVDGAGVVLWTSGQLPGVSQDDIVGLPVWAPVSSEYVTATKLAFTDALGGAKTRNLSSALLAGRMHWFQTHWAPASFPGTDARVCIRVLWLPPEFGALTRRQREIVLAIGEHVEVAAVAEALGLAVATVRSHLKAIALKWGATGVPDVTNWARRYCWSPIH